MADNNQRPAEALAPVSSFLPVPAGDPVAGKAGVNLKGEQREHDLTLELKRGLEKTRLPASLKEQILAELPSWEEQERLYRELQETGGLSFEQFLDSLGLEKPQP